ncbi:MAG: hypothetical protein E7631_06980 [Ruminococcaceae bacterium]|nr:hypothetical protein [Oscillospiraceae bacterium]
MKEIVPSYYSRFRCIAGACRHSCCIGWEIDIDEDTLALYDDPALSLYNRLQQSIDRTDVPHFRLDREERCPFLNRQGLCDIILTLGEDSLCQICADHPRFRNFFSDRTETGLGLCCEAAAALILQETTPMTLITREEDDGDEAADAEEAEFLALRDALFLLLQDRRIPLGGRMSAVLEVCGGKMPVKSTREWAAIFSTLEQLDPAWQSILDKLAVSEEPMQLPETVTPWELQLENLAVYFLFRHLAGALEDNRLAARCTFCACSTAFIHALFVMTCREKGSITTEGMTDLARLYSSEIEYSEENMERLLAMLECD